MHGNLKFLNRNFFGEHQEGDFSWGKQVLSGLGKCLEGAKGAPVSAGQVLFRNLSHGYIL